ncbi:hypothetical protein [Embleya hyalina]|uniref:Secreted protein n=1 Tax=Embleya hyalina TaxID=516124 RepID=A0A401YEE8_9ACTN|nr:hypothetical protein [Embleya hyalina]GCD92973.1 hypothetical protein EHYA_00616 [Embleya hyalina]
MRLRKKTTGTAAAMVMAVGAVAFASGPASAGGCGPVGPCGRVDNNTASDTMSYTLKLDTGGDHRCNVWNFPGGQRTVSCQQQGLNPGKGVGGRLHDGKDVDAFTFPNTGYHVTFNGGITQSYHERGMWTKISNTATAVCKDVSSFQTPYCEVMG